MEDTAKKRWEYLRKTVAANVQRLLGAVCVVTSVLLGLSVFWIIAPTTNNSDQFGVLFYAVLVIVGAGSSVGVSPYTSANCDARRFPYVPPVAEQFATLPAEAILVRGSDQLSAAPEELVRAAVYSDETSASELFARGTGQPEPFGRSIVGPNSLPGQARSEDDLTPKLFY